MCRSRRPQWATCSCSMLRIATRRGHRSGALRSYKHSSWAWASAKTPARVHLRRRLQYHRRVRLPCHLLPVRPRSLWSGAAGGVARGSLQRRGPSTLRVASPNGIGLSGGCSSTLCGRGSLPSNRAKGTPPCCLCYFKHSYNSRLRWMLASTIISMTTRSAARHTPIIYFFWASGLVAIFDAALRRRRRQKGRGWGWAIPFGVLVGWLASALGALVFDGWEHNHHFLAFLVGTFCAVLNVLVVREHEARRAASSGVLVDSEESS